jgi:long-subunit fatty acid transport protein
MSVILISLYVCGAWVVLCTDKAQQAFIAQKMNAPEKQKRTHIDFVSSSKLMQPQHISSSASVTTTTVVPAPLIATQVPTTSMSGDHLTLTTSKSQSSGTTAERKRKSKWDQQSIAVSVIQKTSEESHENKRPKYS